MGIFGKEDIQREHTVQNAGWTISTKTNQIKEYWQKVWIATYREGNGVLKPAIVAELCSTADTGTRTCWGPLVLRLLLTCLCAQLGLFWDFYIMTQLAGGLGLPTRPTSWNVHSSSLIIHTSCLMATTVDAMDVSLAVSGTKNIHAFCLFSLKSLCFNKLPNGAQRGSLVAEVLTL